MSRAMGEATEGEPRERLLRMMKLLYFLNGFSGASFGRFATLFYLDRGLHTHQIGIVEAAQPVSTAIGNQLFGYVSDRLQRKKLVALCARSLTTALLLALPLPRWLGVGATGFEYILLVMVVMAFFAVGGGVLDSYTLDLLGDQRRGEYGKYRLWLAVSWGIGNALMGFVADHLGFDYNFIVSGVLNALAIGIMAAVLPPRTSGECEVLARRRATLLAADERRSGAAEDGRQEAAAAEGAKFEWGKALLSPRALFFFMEMMFIGVAFTVVEKFIFVFVIDELGGSQTLCGLSVAVTVIFEVPLFHYGEQIMRKLGHEAMLLLALVSYSLRTFGYSRLQPSTVWYLLALEPLHGITYGLAWTAAVDKVKADFPPEWQTTGMLLLQTAMWSCGRTFGSLFGGFFMSHGAFLGWTGGRALYACAAVASATVIAAHVLTTAVLRLCGCRALIETPLPSLIILEPLVAPAELPNDSSFGDEGHEGNNGRGEEGVATRVSARPIN
ncbi:hypothetical protein AB1Y20_022146 [Prymnesium parvum]|uniref:Major facilitator superfamily associated domain-containing protein n=1 Tax=Prymnesium parvum TaxID=97485 RepID=A0AB34JI47_PRYPA